MIFGSYDILLYHYYRVGGPPKMYRKDCCGVCNTAIFREILVHNEDKKEI